jgi:prepilin-type processing-associated H-X9-DG protein
VVIGEETIFPGPKSTSMRDVTDGTSNTILIVERIIPICWMDPNNEIQFDIACEGVNRHLLGIGSEHSGGANIAFADGSITFLRQNADGSIAPQILESSQIDMNNPQQKAFFSAATHFNPVDMFCCYKDVNGNYFDLTEYVDPYTGFISKKTYEGRPLIAMELPGLWNGAMADWITIFVEAPLSTFNPVKTALDLLKR